MCERLTTVAYDEVLWETDAAILLRIEISRVWIPLRLIREHDEQEKEVSVPEWFAIQEGLE